MFVKLGRKSLPGTNILGYYGNSEITDKKVYTIGPNVCRDKHASLFSPFVSKIPFLTALVPDLTP